MHRFIVFIIIFLNLGIAAATPSLTGLSRVGNVITIIGSGFSSKTTPGPIFYDNFEDATTGQTINEYSDHWTDKSNEQVFSVIDTLQKVGSTKCVASPDVGVTTAEAWVNNVGFATTSKILLHYWVRIDWGSGTADYYQLKQLTLCYNTEANAASDYPAYALFSWDNYHFPSEGGVCEYYWQMYYDGATPSITHHYPDDAMNYPYTYYPIDDAWVNVTLELYQGTVGNEDATHVSWIVNPGRDYVTKKEVSNFLMLDVAEPINSIHLRGYLGVGGTSAYIYYDDIYVDNSWARIEIGNNSSYDACTKRQIQIASTWADTSVSFPISDEMFQAGDTVYIFIVDINGVVNTNGYSYQLPQAATVSTSAIVKASTGASFVKASSGTTILKAQ